MERTLTTELPARVGSRVLLQGWLHHERRLARVSFALVRDRAGLAQVVLDEPLELTPETVLEVEGVAVASAQAPGGVELHDARVRVIAEPADCSGDEPDLSPADERRVCAEHGELVFVEGFPTRKRPFYTRPDPDRPGASRGFDLLYRGLEIVTGGERLHRYESYLEALAERGLEPEPFAPYLDAFRWGLPPHGGFALGLERWTAQVVGAANVRETTLFPRDRTRLSP